jgi:glycosyltransferase involved in cell wall biosynthesis
MQLITELAPAGAERCVYELARRLDKGSFDVSVAALRGGAVAEMLAEAGVPVRVLDVRSRLDLPRLARLARWMREDRPDVLHTHLYHADLVGRIAASMASVPHVVHTVHTAEARFRPWQFAFAHLAARSCDRIVAVSESARDHHAARAHLPLDVYTVIPNGVDVAAFARDPAARATLRRQWGAADDEFIFAYVGRLSEEKGVETLLEAVSLPAARQAGLRLVIAGDGPRRTLVERFLVTPAGERTRWLGFVKDVRGVLSAADALVMPSRWEGFGLAAAEAMAAALPVVASDVPGLRDVVDDGATGVLVPAEDAARLAEAMGRLARDRETCARMGAAGHARAAARFDISRTVLAHAELYRQVCGC